MPDGQAVHAVGPDGKHYQFPPDWTVDRVTAYFKKPASDSDAGTPPSFGKAFIENTPLGPLVDWWKREGPTVPGVLHAVGLPGSWEESKKMGEEQAKKGFWRSALEENPIVDQAKMLWSIPSSMVKQEIRAAKTSGDDPMRAIRALSGLNPFSAPVTEQMDVLREQGASPHDITSAGLTGAGLLSLGLRDQAPLVERQLRSQLRQMTKQQILEQAHAKLNSQVEPTNQMIRDVPLANMRQEVGQHVQGLDAGDIAKSPNGRPQVSTTSLHPLLDDITNSHRSVVGSSRFSQATDEVQNLPANAYWKDVHDAKMNVRSLWAKAAEGSPEKSALNKLATGMEDILSQRASEIGQTAQYNKYRELTRAYHTYESTDNVVGKLLNTPLGKDYFNILRDPAYADQLSAASKDFAKYGLPEDTLSRLTQNNAQLHDYVTVASKSGGFRGKIRAITAEPTAALLGMFGGQAIGKMLGHPTLGGLIGAMKGAEMAETAGARRALAEQGLAPSREIIGGPVQPGPAGPGAASVRGRGGAGPAPTGPSFDPQAISDLVGTIKNLGWKVSDKLAEAMAKSALDEAGGDVNKAAEALASRGKTAKKISDVKPVSGAAPVSTRGTYSAEPPKPGFGTATKGIEDWTPAELAARIEEMRVLLRKKKEEK